MPSTHITFERKQKDIRRAAEEGNLIPPSGNAAIWEALKSGFTRTAQKYHYKYAQFWFLLLLAHHLKGLPNLAAVIANPQDLQKALDLIIENIPNKVDRAYDMRHAILYMVFPDLYERIISTRDKERILEKYRNRIQKPVPVDLDEALRKIRAALSGQYDKPDRAFDFYQDLKEEWKPGKMVTAETIPTETGPGLVTVPEGGEPTSEVQELETEVTEHT